MEKAKDIIDKMTRDLIKENLGKCTKEQRDFFKKLYPDGIKGIEYKNLTNALDQCLRQVEKNNESYAGKIATLAGMETRLEGNKATVKSFILELLRTLLVEQDEFSARYPWGNSSWDFYLDVPISMVFPEIVLLTLDDNEPDWWDCCSIKHDILDREKYNKIMSDLVDYITIRDN